MAESTVILTKRGRNADPSIRKLEMAFLDKLTTDDALPGLHIEPINNSADPRARTGRVNDNYRAVLFRLNENGSPAYVYCGAYPHDEGTALAQRMTLNVNPLNGILEIRETEIAPSRRSFVAPQGSPQPKAPVDDRPRVLGHTEAELTQLGIDAELAAIAADATSEDKILSAAEIHPDWQQNVLLDLLTGVPFDEIATRLKAGATPADPEGDEDARIIKAVKTNPETQASFTYIDNNDELRQAVEAGDFGAWRVWLHPTQRRLVVADYKGPYRLAGGAGTGKTVVLVHRARRLWRADESRRVLLTTFTTNLAEGIAEQLALLDSGVPITDQPGQSGVCVVGIDALAARVLKQAGAGIAEDVEAVLGHARAEVARRTSNQAWQDAIDSAGTDLQADLRRAEFFASEYAAVILPNRITDERGYLRVRRPGRGVRLAKAARQAVWRVVQAYRTASRVDGAIDFTEAALIAATHLQRTGALFDHVLVDEAQDLGPAHLLFVRALAAEGPNDVFLAEDAHQRIYGARIVLSHYGLQVRGRSSRLKLNYRTTAQNLRLAQQILEGGDWVDGDEGTEDHSGYRSARQGPEPTLAESESLTVELDRAAHIVKAWLADGAKPETIAILVRDHRDRDRVTTALSERGVKVRAAGGDRIPAGAPVVMTMHRAKGTEFSRVLLFGISEASIPKSHNAYAFDPDAQAEAVLRERALLYVAATRARDALAVSWSGAASSLLPNNSPSPQD
ncbi:3'-5' exonuclease [Ammonicoccus fulvus]|uniref:DNA 3'-5' helicase n=1 Tax=Ammonicoccus fulvus TaxID=3138240 RepID=A0ABZ3FJ00_9ACTN